MTRRQSAHPKPAVSVIIVDGGRILLVKRGCEPNRGLWSLPGGSIEPGEKAREAAAREVFEETSLNVDVGSVADVHDVIAERAGVIAFHYVIISFYASVSSGKLQAASDAADARWVPLAQIREYPTTAGLVERLEKLGILG